jgi:PadR family transcriptional regulator, regulatory protein PadR
MAKRRMSAQTQAILAVVMADVQGRHYGFEIARRAGLATGTVSPVLAKLERDGWLESYWEQIDSVAEGRRPRRYYTVTALGAQEADCHRQEVLRELSWGQGGVAAWT